VWESLTGVISVPLPGNFVVEGSNLHCFHWRTRSTGPVKWGSRSG
jgi:hypothetical protein